MFLATNEVPTEEELAFEPPPLFVYADYEATQDEDSPILTCAEQVSVLTIYIIYANFTFRLDLKMTVERSKRRFISAFTFITKSISKSLLIQIDILNIYYRRQRGRVYCAGPEFESKTNGLVSVASLDSYTSSLYLLPMAIVL